MVLRPADSIKRRQKDDTLLLVGIGACNNRNNAFRLAKIVGQMRHISRDVDKVSGPSGKMLFQSLAIPHSGFAAQDIEGGLVVPMFVRFSLSARWDRQDLQMNPLSAHRFGRNAWGVGQGLLSDELWPRSDDLAGRLSIVMDRFRRWCVVHLFQNKS